MRSKMSEMTKVKKIHWGEWVGMEKWEVYFQVTWVGMEEM